MIYCVGDSHVSVFSGKNDVSPSWDEPIQPTWDILPDFKTHRIGPFLAYSMGIEGHLGRELMNKVLENIEKGSSILLVFGEIDCRAHLLKQRDKQGRPIEDIVAECVAQYIKAPCAVAEAGYKVAVFGGIPSGCRATLGWSDDRWGWYGTAYERNYTAKLFDSNVSKECTNRGLPFVSIFDKLVDEKLETRQEYFFDEIHLGQKSLQPLVERLKELGFGS